MSASPTDEVPSLDVVQRPALPGQRLRLRVHAARRPGRGHRRLDVPCQDAHATWTDGERAAVAVADGLGSCPLSQHGSQAAAAAAVVHLAGEPAWDEPALRRAFAAAREAVLAEAVRLGAPASDLATTLQVAVRDGGTVLAGMVGDGAVVAGLPVQVLLAPESGGYANEVVPLTADGWQGSLRLARLDGPGTADASSGPPAGAPVLLFTDGLTRLLLARADGQWTPFTPFFDRFLPALAADPEGGLLQRFLDGDDVDRCWDDDKCLAVILDAD